MNVLYAIFSLFFYIGKPFTGQEHPVETEYPATEDLVTPTVLSEEVSNYRRLVYILDAYALEIFKDFAPRTRVKNLEFFLFLIMNENVIRGDDYLIRNDEPVNIKDSIELLENAAAEIERIYPSINTIGK